MANGHSVILAAGTAAYDSGTAATYADFTVRENKPVTLVGFGMATTETFSVMVSHDGGTTFVDCYDAGSQVLIGGSGAATPQNPLTLYGPGRYRVARTQITAGNAGVTKYENP